MIEVHPLSGRGAQRWNALETGFGDTACRIYRELKTAFVVVAREDLDELEQAALAMDLDTEMQVEEHRVDEAETRTTVSTTDREVTVEGDAEVGLEEATMDLRTMVMMNLAVIMEVGGAVAVGAGETEMIERTESEGPSSDRCL